MDKWVQVFGQILQTDMGALEQATSDADQIDKLNKEEGWKLKGIVSGTLLNLLEKYE